MTRAMLSTIVRRTSCIFAFAASSLETRALGAAAAADDDDDDAGTSLSARRDGAAASISRARTPRRWGTRPSTTRPRGARAIARCVGRSVRRPRARRRPRRTRTRVGGRGSSGSSGSSRLDVAALARQRRGVDHGVRGVARGRPGVADERDDRLSGLEGGPIRPRGIVRVLREDVQRDALERRGRPAVLSRSVARPHRARAPVRILRGAADEAERQRGHVSSASEPAPGTVRGRRRAQKRGGARRALGKNEEKKRTPLIRRP